MRYLGGTLGGTWLTALTGDMGSGIFDGANLVANFRSLNPANTYWGKVYNVYSKVDTEAHRFLDFETWWGSPVLLNAGEMQWIADNLFVGNKLTAGEIRTSSASASTCATSSRRSSCCARGATSRRRSRRWAGLPTSTATRTRSSPTADHRLHAAPDDRPSRHLRLGQGGDQGTCRVRLVHGDDRPDAAGLYEAVIDEVDESSEHRDLIHGKYLFRLEARTGRHPRARRQQRRRQPAFRRGRPPVGNQPRPLPHARPAGGAGDDDRAVGRDDAADASQPPALHHVLRQEPDDAAGQGAGRVRARRASRWRPTIHCSRSAVTSTWITTWWESYQQARDGA
jgi:hypothetical protein